jgi:hypothetical protein
MKTAQSTFATIAALAFFVGCAPAPSTQIIPSTVRYVSRADWGAHAPVLPMKEHVPTRLTIHHTGEPQAPNRTLEQKLRGLQAFSQRDDSLDSGKKKPAWADIPYHFYLATDGSIGEGRDWHYSGDTNTTYDPTGHLLLVIEGSFDRDTLTTAQRRTLDIVVPALAKRFHIPPERLASHKDFAETSCPGKNVYAELPRLRELIRRQASGK